MTVVGEAFIAIKPDTKGFGPQAEKEVSAGLTQVVASGAKILAGLAVGQKIKQTFTEGLDELKQAAQVQAQTTAGIASTGGAAGVTAQHVQDLAGSIEDLAGFDDEAVQQGENLLLTFCLEDEAQALTMARGWVHHGDLAAGDLILTYDPDDGAIRWEPVESMHRFQVDGELVRWQSKQIDVATTPHHRWWTEAQHRTLRYTPQFRTTAEISGHNVNVRIGGGYPECFAPEPTWSDDLVELLGWVFTEGWFVKAPHSPGARGVGFCQSATANPVHVKRIRLLVDRLRAAGHRINEYEAVHPANGSRIVSWGFAFDLGATVRSLLPGKRLTPSLLTLLTLNQAQLLLDVLIAGDGHIDAHGHEQFIQKDADQLDMVAMLAAMLGRRSTVLGRGDSLYLPTTNHLRGHRVNHRSQPYQGTVWCPSIRTGVFLARCRGRTFWTGNTNIRNEAGAGNDIFDQTSLALANVAARMGTDVPSAAVQLGKALNDPTEGLAALRRIGITFTDQQKEQVKALQASGDLLGAQKIVLAELNKEFGGSAEQLGNSIPGALNKAKEASNNAKAALVEGLTPAIKAEAAAQQFMADTLLALPEPLRAVVGITLAGAGAFSSLVVPLKAGIDLLRVLHPAQVAAAGSAAEVAVAEGAAGTAGVGGAAGLGAMAVAEDAVAVNSAAAVSGLYATEAATISLESAFPPLLVATLALTAAFALLGPGSGDTLGGSIKGLDQEVKTLTGDLADLKTAVGDDLAKNIDTLVKGDTDLAGAFAAGGITVKQFSDALRSGAAGFHALIDPLRESGQLSDVNALKLAQLAKAQEDSAQAALDQALAQGEVNQQQVDAAVAANTAADGTVNYLGAVDALAGSSSTLATAQGQVEQTAEEAAKALADQDQAAKDLQSTYQSLIDQTLGAFNASLQLSDAQIASRKAQDDLAAAVKAGNDGTRTAQQQQDLLTSATNNAFQAILSEAKANEDLQRAQVESTGGTFTAQQAQQSLIDELNNVADSLDPNSPLRDQLAGYVLQLANVPKEVPTAVHADTAAASQAIIDFERQLLGIPTGVDIQLRAFHTGGEGAGTQMAEGGLVAARPGGIHANIAEGGRAEGVFPLPPGLVDGLVAIGRGAAVGGGPQLLFGEHAIDARGASPAEVYDQWLTRVRNDLARMAIQT